MLMDVIWLMIKLRRTALGFHTMTFCRNFRLLFIVVMRNLFNLFVYDKCCLLSVHFVIKISNAKKNICFLFIKIVSNNEFIVQEVTLLKPLIKLGLTLFLIHYYLELCQDLYLYVDFVYRKNRNMRNIILRRTISFLRISLETVLASFRTVINQVHCIHQLDHY